MNSQTNPNFFTKKDTESELSLENVFKTLDRAVAYKSSYDRFYSSANQIIGAVNERNFNKLLSEYDTLTSSQDAIMGRGDLEEINSSIQQSMNLYKGLQSFIGTQDNINKGFEDYAEKLDSLSKLTWKYKAFKDDLLNSGDGIERKDAIKDSDPLISSNQFAGDPVSADSSFELYNSNYGSHYDSFMFHESLEKSFMSGRSYYSPRFTEFQRKVIDNTSEVGNLINQLNILEKSTPTFTSKTRKKGIIYKLRKKYQEIISPEARNAIEYLFYKYEVEGL